MNPSKYNLNKIHFIGIGGSGMSGIAEVLFNLGYKITGSDQSHSSNTSRLENLGIEIQYQHKSCLLYTSPSPRDKTPSRMPSSA